MKWSFVMRGISKGVDRGRAVVVVAALFAICMIDDARAQESYFQLTSPAFSDNGMMAAKYAGKNPSNPNCIGENISPPLQWVNPPAGTRSFALIMHDQEGRNGLGVTHWVIYGIDGTAREIGEGSGTNSTASFTSGKNVLGQNSYLGACPPKGTGPHHYVFTLVATRLEPGALQAGLAQSQLLEAIGSNAIGATGLIGRFGH